MKLGSPKTRPLTGLQCRALSTLNSKTSRFFGRANFFWENSFGGQLVWGANFFGVFYCACDTFSRGASALGGFLIGGLWFSWFCPGAFCGGILTGHHYSDTILQYQTVSMLKFTQTVVCCKHRSIYSYHTPIQLLLRYFIDFL